MFQGFAVISLFFIILVVKEKFDCDEMKRLA